MADSLRGQYLIAGKWLRDENFFKTVVLLVEHGSGGAMGLVVNRPSSITVAAALAQHFNIPDSDDVVYLGGPVETDSLFVLHDVNSFEFDEAPVIPGLYVGSSEKVFENVVSSVCNGNEGLNYRIYSGCAGWAPGQLESEVDRGDWYVYPATADLVFDENPYEVWDALLAKVKKSTQILPDVPGDPSLN